MYVPRRAWHCQSWPGVHVALATDRGPLEAALERGRARAEFERLHVSIYCTCTRKSCAAPAASPIPMRVKFRNQER